MKNNKRIKLKIGMFLMAIGVLFSQSVLPISALEIDVPTVDSAGQPKPGLTIEVENTSQNTGNYAVGDILKYTVTFTNDEHSSTWFDIQASIVLSEGLELSEDYPITVNGVEDEAIYDVASKTISADLGDIEGEDVHIEDDVILYTISEQEYVVIEFCAVVSEAGSLKNVTLAVDGRGIDATFEDLDISKTLSVYINGTDAEILVSETPTIDGIKKGDNKVTGTGVPEAELTVTLPDGSEVITIVEADGTWSIDVPSTITLNEGDEVTAVQKELGKEVSQPASEIVQGLEQSEVPVIDTIYSGDDKVTGTGVPGAEITVTFPDGSEVITIVEADGTWSVDVPESITLNKDDKVTATQKEAGKEVSQPSVSIVQTINYSEVPTKKNSTTPTTQTPSVDTSISSSTTINDVNTGDKTNKGVLYGMLMLSFAGVVAIITKRKIEKSR